MRILRIDRVYVNSVDANSVWENLVVTFDRGGKLIVGAMWQ